MSNSPWVSHKRDARLFLVRSEPMEAPKFFEQVLGLYRPWMLYVLAAIAGAVLGAWAF